MNDEKVFSEYWKKFPHTLTIRQIDFDNEEFMTMLIQKMETALRVGKPLSDDIFGLPDDAEY